MTNGTVTLPPDLLTIEQRACLLRPARLEIRKMQIELYRLKKLPPQYAAGPIAAVEAEINCLAAAVSWVWRQPTKG